MGKYLRLHIGCADRPSDRLKYHSKCHPLNEQQRNSNKRLTKDLKQVNNERNQITEIQMTISLQSFVVSILLKCIQFGHVWKIHHKIAEI